MKNSLAKECKDWLEKREKCCSFCGFNYNGRVANIFKDCLANDCNYLIKKMKLLKPYYDAKMMLIIKTEKPVNEQIAEKQKYLYLFYIDNCSIDLETPLSFDDWLLYCDKLRNEKVIPKDKINSKEDYEMEDFIK